MCDSQSAACALRTSDKSSLLHFSTMDPKTTRPNIPRSIPDRWLAYEPHGTTIQGTNILAFKVPLKESISRNLPPDQQFTPAILMRKFPKLRYIVDLTNTNRYYQPKEFMHAGIKHIKILIPGRMVPSMDGVERFFKAMETFSSIANSDELIGVHCTHGINRTGYLICRYLVQQFGWEPQKSVNAFEKARGYSIERAEYVTEIMRAPRIKLDVSSVSLEATQSPHDEFTGYHSRRTSMRQGPMMQSKFDIRTQRFANGRHRYPLPPRQPFGYGGPSHAFGPRPPIPPPLPPPPGRLYGPRPHAYGMPPMRPPLPPPGPVPFPGARFPSRMPGPPCMQGPPRLPPPPVGPQPRLPGPGMPPPRLPPPGMISPRLASPRIAPPRHPLSGMPTPRLSNVRRSREHLRREVQGHGPLGYKRPLEATRVPQGTRGLVASPSQGASSKIHKDVDFTLDTFEENLTASVCP